MNDWLNYKGSGSIRANANTLEHAASIPNSGRMNSIREKARDAALNVRDKNGESYESINTELDALYNDLQVQSNKMSKVTNDIHSLVNAAHQLKASMTIASAGIISANKKAQSISSKIASFHGSSLQKTALKNKFNSMVDKFQSKLDTLESNPITNIDFDTFAALIDNINNNTSQIYRR